MNLLACLEITLFVTSYRWELCPEPNGRQHCICATTGRGFRKLCASEPNACSDVSTQSQQKGLLLAIVLFLKRSQTKNRSPSCFSR